MGFAAGDADVLAARAWLTRHGAISLTACRPRPSHIIIEMSMMPLDGYHDDDFLYICEKHAFSLAASMTAA